MSIYARPSSVYRDFISLSSSGTIVFKNATFQGLFSRCYNYEYLHKYNYCCL